jgi:hypothetical protein
MGSSMCIPRQQFDMMQKEMEQRHAIRVKNLEQQVQDHENTVFEKDNQIEQLKKEVEQKELAYSKVLDEKKELQVSLDGILIQIQEEISNL